MSQPAKAQEPSMEEILASIRRIIADDDATKATKPPEPITPQAAAPAPPPRPATPPQRPAPPPAASNTQSAIDAMLVEAEKPLSSPSQRMGAKPEVLDLTEAQVAQPPSSSFRTIDGNSDVVFSERPPDAPPEMRLADDLRRAAVASPPPAAPLTDRGLLSGAAASAVDQAFNSLANTVLGNNARTLEDLVKEMLRPMLKSWLDDNLPGLVDRIVRAEIERVSRGRG